VVTACGRVYQKDSQLRSGSVRNHQSQRSQFCRAPETLASREAVLDSVGRMLQQEVETVDACLLRLRTERNNNWLLPTRDYFHVAMRCGCNSQAFIESSRPSDRVQSAFDLPEDLRHGIDCSLVSWHRYDSVGTFMHHGMRSDIGARKDSLGLPHVFRRLERSAAVPR
jgi:hypothetical protein